MNILFINIDSIINNLNIIPENFFFEIKSYKNDLNIEQVNLKISIELIKQLSLEFNLKIIIFTKYKIQKNTIDYFINNYNLIEFMHDDWENALIYNDYNIMIHKMFINNNININVYIIFDQENNYKKESNNYISCTSLKNDNFYREYLKISNFLKEK